MWIKPHLSSEGPQISDNNNNKTGDGVCSEVRSAGRRTGRSQEALRVKISENFEQGAHRIKSGLEKVVSRSQL